MQLDDERSILLARVASLYYDHDKSQQDIADEVGVSRSAISRFLTEARERGIVEIIVHYPWRTCPELEQKLISTFNLKAARVLARENKSYEEMLQGLGILAARYLDNILHDGMIIGISWGSALYQMIRALPMRDLPGVEAVQLIGATGSESLPSDGPILAQLLSNRLGGFCRYLHAPLVVENEAGREVLLQARNIRETLARAEQADVALVGIGSTNSEFYSLLRAGYVDEAETQRIRAAGAVGDICAQHYSLTGQWLDIDINRRTIGIDLETLSKIKTVIGVAGSSRKGAAIFGALRGGYLNVLITDDQAAQKVLALGHNL
ncbi:MAG TPA: sugar-binding transcriptional regulator [Anaerolineae bacterium]|nr:sugar-binding transcriptional regulator [Anaerolineae bacterium]